MTTKEPKSAIICTGAGTQTIRNRPVLYEAIKF
jgi:hypothetical protein